MIYSSVYSSPVGELVLSADENALTRLSFGGKAEGDKKNAIIIGAERWLDEYFSGKEPAFSPKTAPEGTPFQREVWEILKKIPYGRVISYGDIAAAIAKRRGIKRMSAQAVGQAVGKNPIAIIIPCHRVVGADLSLTGYGGGMERKKFLLEVERADLTKLYRI